jgi:hypothetical protein
MQKSYSQQIVGTLSNLKILLIVGAVAVTISIIIDGLYPDSLVWALSVLVGFNYYRLTQIFTKNPNIEILNNMVKFYKLFIFVWITAAALTAILGFFWIDTLLGIGIVIAATFFMNDVNSNAKFWLDELTVSPE